MINIYICEDDKRQLDFIKKTISDAILFDDTDMKLVLPPQYPDEILECAKKSKNCGLYFLDVGAWHRFFGRLSFGTKAQGN